MVLLPSHSFTQWGQLGEILGGVQNPCAAPAAIQLAALALGSSVEYGQTIRISKAGAALRFAELPRG